ncbi:MAG: hypothetical protein RJA35_549 [Actinomycetota bacterium]
MSDLLHLANSIRTSTDAEVLALLRRRTGFGAPKDFFDLAQALLSSKSLTPALTKLSGSEARTLAALIGLPGDPTAGLKPEVIQQAQASLVELGLAFASASGSIQVLDAVKDAAAPILRNLPPERDPFPATGLLVLPVDGSVLGLAAIAAFETQQAICELLLDAEQHPIKLTGKTGFGVSDVKRVAAHLRRSNQTIRGFYALAEQLQLLILIGERWWLSGGAEQFLNGSVIDRWSKLAQQWISSLGPVGARELNAVLKEHPELDLAAALKHVFPLADISLGEELNLLAEQAQGIGFSVAGQPSVLLAYCLNGQPDVAADLLKNHLPQLQHSLIVQADLSLIAPGPLDTATETTLRKFAEIEQVSVACTYRLSALSVSHGLECGLTVDQIRAMLQELSAKPLPQPVEYLLKEAEQRFGRLTIKAGKSGSEKSVLHSSDGILLTEILNDSRLRAFAFFALTANSLVTRFDPEIVYFGLRDNGYLPVRLDDSGAVISPRAAHNYSGGLANSSASPQQLLVDNLRASDARVGAQPDDQDLTRQIQLAVKNKAALTVYAEDRSGNEVEFRILPTALANGRLRGMDRRSDVERTLPLDRIKRVELG